MKKAVAYLTPFMEEEKAARAAAGEAVRAQGKIVLATVKGDVHDIGKNIVGVVLACNNYEVIDMGVMVPCEKILERARTEKADLIGLSGLITPSLDEMTHVAREMERQGFKLPLLIGGATTSRAHTAVKIAPHYSEPVVHVLDASRAVPVTTTLLSHEGKPAFVAQHRAEYEELRRMHGGPKQKLLADRAGARQPHARSPGGPRMFRRPEFRGVRVLDDVPLATLREYIDWTPFFHTWELKGVYPTILDHEKYGEQARTIFAEGNALLDVMVNERLIKARGVYGLFPAKPLGDDVEVYDDAGRPLDALSLPAPAGGQGRRAVAQPRRLHRAARRRAWPITSAASRSPPGFGLKELCDRFRAKNDDYNAIMAEALADRLAEAFAEYLHERVRREWGFGRDEGLTQGAADPRGVPRHPPGRRLSRLPRSHREGDALAPARRRHGTPASR